MQHTRPSLVAYGKPTLKRQIKKTDNPFPADLSHASLDLKSEAPTKERMQIEPVKGGIHAPRERSRSPTVTPVFSNTNCKSHVRLSLPRGNFHSRAASSA